MGGFLWALGFANFFDFFFFFCLIRLCLVEL
jgi:hypothetical protein